ncbi:Ig-like domain-containing protein, partial [Candidatus Riflebacteria bacterium]
MNKRYCLLITLAFVGIIGCNFFDSSGSSDDEHNITSISGTIILPSNTVLGKISRIRRALNLQGLDIYINSTKYGNPDRNGRFYFDNVPKKTQYIIEVKNQNGLTLLKVISFSSGVLNINTTTTAITLVYLEAIKKSSSVSIATISPTSSGIQAIITALETALADANTYYSLPIGSTEVFALYTIDNAVKSAAAPLVGGTFTTTTTSSTSSSTSLASNFYPKYGAKDVPVDVELSWSVPDGVLSTVYLNANASATTPVLVNSLYKSVKPGTLQKATNYYWRVDTNLHGTIGTGQEYKFETAIPPTVKSTFPENNASDTGVNITLTANFSEEIASASVNDNSFVVRDLTNDITIVSSEISIKESDVLFKPKSDLFFYATHTVTLTTDIMDLASNTLEQEYTWTFVTGGKEDSAAPALVSANPAKDSTGTNVRTDTAVVVRFSEKVVNVNAVTFTLVSSLGVAITPTSITKTDDTFHEWTFNHNGMVASETYTVTLSADIKDIEGNSLTATTFTFETDGTPPQVSNSNPADGETQVQANNASLTILFTEDIDFSSVNTTNISLTTGGAQVTGAFSISSPSQTLVTFTPLTGQWSPGATYTLLLSAGGVQDLSGNGLGSPYSATFITDGIGPSVASSTPTNGASGDQVPTVNAKIIVTFSEAVDPTSVNSANFIVIRDFLGGVVGGTYALSQGNSVVTFTPTTGVNTAGVWDQGVVYRLTLQQGGIKDPSGNGLQTSYSITFTPDGNPPSVVTKTPGDNATNIGISDSVNLSFSEAMATSTIDTSAITLLKIQDATTVSITNASYDGTQAVFTHDNFDTDASYTLTLNTS